ncbi:aop3, partial [Symbiodinium natans]
MGMSSVFLYLSCLCLFFMGQKDRSRSYNMIACLVTFIAGSAYLGMSSGLFVHVVDGRHVYCLRYVDWCFTTALMLLDLALMRGADMKATAALIGIDVAMILMALMAALSTSSAGKWGFFGMGAVCFAGMVAFLFTALQRAAEKRGGEAEGKFKFVASRTIEIWCLYPVIFALGELTHTIPEELLVGIWTWVGDTDDDLDLVNLRNQGCGVLLQSMISVQNTGDQGPSLEEETDPDTPQPRLLKAAGSVAEAKPERLCNRRPKYMFCGGLPTVSSCRSVLPACGRFRGPRIPPRGARIPALASIGAAEHVPQLLPAASTLVWGPSRMEWPPPSKMRSETHPLHVVSAQMFDTTIPEDRLAACLTVRVNLKEPAGRLRNLRPGSCSWTRRSSHLTEGWGLSRQQD